MIGSSAPNGSSINSTLRLGRERPGDADALLLAAGQLVRIARSDIARGSSWKSVSSSSTRASMRALSQPSSSGTVAMFCATVRCGNSPWPWMA